MKFEFIDNNGAVDGAVRKQIRSQAARGHNLGRKLSRPSKKMVFGRPSRTQLQGNEPVVEASTEATVPVRLPRALSAFPAHWRQYHDERSGGLALFQRATLFLGGIRHAPELDVALDYSSEPRTRWIQPFFVNEAYFHGALAVFMTAFPSWNPSSNNQAARVRHLCLALRLVNAQLSGRDAASDETIVVVLVLGLYERYQGEYQRGLVHLDGLRRILDLRGGIREVSTSASGLARKIFRTDIEYSINLGAPPRFSLQDVQPVTTPIYLDINSQELLLPPHTPSLPFPKPPAHNETSFHPSLPIPLSLQHLLRDATLTAHRLHTATTSPAFKLSSRAVHDTFILLGYRLQALSPLLPLHTISAAGDAATVTKETVLEQAICVGLTAFVASFLWGGGCGMVKNRGLGWVARMARGVVARWDWMRKGLSCGGWEGEVLLWMVFVCVAAGVLEGGEVDGWVGERTREWMTGLGLGSVGDWEGVGRVLERFPWVAALHGRKGRAFFERCTSRLGNGTTESI